MEKKTPKEWVLIGKYQKNGYLGGKRIQVIVIGGRCLRLITRDV